MRQFLRAFLPRKIDAATPPAAPVIRKASSPDPFQTARIRLAGELGSVRADETLARVKVFSADPPVEAIERLGPRRFAGFLSSEHPEAVSLFVAALPEKLRVAVVEELDPRLHDEDRGTSQAAASSAAGSSADMSRL